MFRQSVVLLVLPGWVLLGSLPARCEPPKEAPGKGENPPLPPGALARLGTARFLNYGRTFAVAFSPDGKRLAAGGWDGSVCLYDVDSGKRLVQLAGHDGWVKTVAFSPDGGTVASAGRDKEIRLWDAVTGQPRQRLTGHPAEVGAVAFTADGKGLVARGQNGAVRFWDIATGRQLRQVGTEAERTRPDALPILLSALSPEGGTLATLSSTEDGILSLWDSASGKQLRRCSNPEGMSRRYPFSWAKTLAFTPDGKALALGGYQPKVRLWDVGTGKELRPLDLQGGQALSLAFSPDGRVLATVSVTGNLDVWEVFSGLQRCHFQVPDRGDLSIAFAPGGRVLASGSLDNTILLWDATGIAWEVGASPAALTRDALQSLWADLSGRDGGKAHRAVWNLTAAAGQSVGFLKENLVPARPVDPARIEQWLRDLDDSQFSVRDDAYRQLETTGEVARSALRKAVQAGGTSAEVRRRVQQLLEKLDADKATPSAEQLRFVRAVEVLEHIGSPEARQALQTLAGGAPEAWLTREAAAALKRLGTPTK